MKTFNKFLAIICGLFLFVTASCDQKTIGGEYTISNEGVSFLTPTAAITVPPTQTSLEYKMVRGNLSGRIEVPLTVTCDKNIFTIPSSIVFEDGSGMAVMTIPLEKTVLGTTYSIVMAIDSSKMAEFGKAKTTISIMRDYNWVSAGPAQWTDGIVSYIFGEKQLTYPVTLQKADGTVGMFRMVNPYGLGVYKFTEAGDVVRNPSYVVIDATKPDQVLIKEQGIGINYGYGEIFFATYQSNYGKYSGSKVTFPKGTLAAGMRSYNNGAFSWVIDPCELTIGEPEKVYDYSAKVTYTGRNTNPADETFASAKVTLGADVAYGKMALVAGGMSQEVMDGIVNGSIKSDKISGSGDFTYPLVSQGRWTFVVVTYDDKDKAKESGFASFNYITGGSTLYPIEDFYGEYVMKGFDPFEDEEVEISQEVKIAPGDAPNTLIITGIQYAAAVQADFPVKGFMSIAPQKLADYGKYDITLYSIKPDWKTSSSAPMIFTRIDSGDIIMTADSYAIGYLLRSEAAGGWVDGIYDITFTPVAAAKSVPAKAAANSAPVLKSKAKDYTKQFSNYFIQEKLDRSAVREHVSF